MSSACQVKVSNRAVYAQSRQGLSQGSMSKSKAHLGILFSASSDPEKEEGECPSDRVVLVVLFCGIVGFMGFTGLEARA